jgi:phosphatidylglycerophosphate synthase
MLAKVGRIYSDRIVNPIAKLLAKAGIQPNLLSLLGLLFSIIAAFFIGGGYLKSGALIFTLAGTLDVLDGALARNTKKSSLLGSYLDSVLDRYSDMTALIGVLYFFLKKSYNAEIMLCIGVLCGFFLVSYTRARAESLISFPPGVGLMERPERMIFLIIGLLLNKVYITLWLLLFLTHLTAIYRILYTYNKLRK